jgi:GNAT superfamily N-acetyltransferase
MHAVETSTDRVAAPLALFGAIHRAAVRAEWAAAQATGLDIRVVDDGEILLGAAPDFPSTMFNRALGFAEAPDRIGEAVAFFARHGVQGEIVLDPADVPSGVAPRLRLEAYLADPAVIPAAPMPGLTIRVIETDDTATWMDVVVEGYAPAAEVGATWRSIAAGGARDGHIRLLGELDGQLVAASSIFVSGERGWLSWATVLPAARGLGIQRAMIAARARVAADAGCTVIAAWALASAYSSRNLALAGMPLVGERVSVAATDVA